MFSVTSRIRNIRQPRLGYIPVDDLNTTKYFDRNEIEEVNIYYDHIQGMVVDYLTRFMTGTCREVAFKISLAGANIVNELNSAKDLLSKVKGLDEKSIIAACQLVGYDVAFRRGSQYFTPVNKILPDKKVIGNIVVLVKRSVYFLKANGPIVLDGFSFEGGYNSIISAGDGDYLTTDTLWDFKVSGSKPKISHTLQVLVYYILGIHSSYIEFKKIKKLGLYNPKLNVAYTISLSDISDQVFYNVSRDVIGYCMPKNVKDWKYATGTSEKAKKELLELFEEEYGDTGFSPAMYKDGIHDITVDDYWSFYRKITATEDNYYQLCRPKFTRTHSVKLIKNSGFIMFVSISKKGTTSILLGGSLRRLKKPLQYYYERLPEYANLILNKFSRYWDALYSISSQIQSIVPNNEELKDIYKKYIVTCKLRNDPVLPYEVWCENDSRQYYFSGKVHGCIVDIDYYNHIYLNPYDGSIVPYYALSIDNKYVYKNILSLISDKRSEMLPTFERALESNIDKESAELMLEDTTKKRMLSSLDKNEIDTYNVSVSDTSMYDISKRMKQLQRVYDHRLVTVWYDDILPSYELGKDTPPAVKQEKMAPIKHRNLQKKSYVGKTAIMNCGLKATVIEDFGCNNITVKFEDGLVKKNCRRDKFREGKIGHKI